MRTHVICLLYVLGLAVIGTADTLTWDYKHGWTAGHVLVIDTTKATITLNDRGKKTVKTVKMMNSANVVSYLNSLLAKYPASEMGVVMDGEHSLVTFEKDGSKTQRGFCEVIPPCVIAYNEGYSAENELIAAEQFKSTVDGFLARNLLFQLIRKYFPDEERKHVVKEQPSTIAPVENGGKVDGDAVKEASLYGKMVGPSENRHFGICYSGDYDLIERLGEIRLEFGDKENDDKELDGEFKVVDVELGDLADFINKLIPVSSKWVVMVSDDAKDLRVSGILDKDLRKSLGRLMQGDNCHCRVTDGVVEFRKGRGPIMAIPQQKP